MQTPASFFVRMGAGARFQIARCSIRLFPVPRYSPCSPRSLAALRCPPARRGVWSFPLARVVIEDRERALAPHPPASAAAANDDASRSGSQEDAPGAVAVTAESKAKPHAQKQKHHPRKRGGAPGAGSGKRDAAAAAAAAVNASENEREQTQIQPTATGTATLMAQTHVHERVLSRIESLPPPSPPALPDSGAAGTVCAGWLDLGAIALCVAAVRKWTRARGACT